VDTGAGSWSRHSVERQLLRLAGTKGERLKQEESSESARQKALSKELDWVRQNPKGRQAKSKARIARFEELNSQEYQKRNETQEIFIRWQTGWATKSSRSTMFQSVWRPFVD